MTREQEIIMGAHTNGTGPTTVARIATTTLVVAAAGVVGSGTALAHDDGSGHDGSAHHEWHGHTGRSVDGGSEHGGTAADAAREEAARARTEARQTVQDALADLGMGSAGSGGADGSDDPGGTGDGNASGRSGSADATPVRQATSTPQPSHPSSGPRTTTQPIAATPNPQQGPTETVPIR